MTGQNFKKVTRSAPHGPCATGKFSNFENFAADSKMFENFAADLNFFEKIPANSKNWMGNLSMAHHFLYL
jgi:hypothetical protein